MPPAPPDPSGQDPDIDYDLLHDLDVDGGGSSSGDGAAAPASTGPSTVAVAHHVFSSSGGYRTLHIGARLQPLQPALEAIASPLCTHPSDDTRWYAFPLEGRQVLAKAFNAGVDDAGRPRVCVHSIVVERPVLDAAWPHYNPTRFPGEWFLGSSAKLDDEHALVEALSAQLEAPPAPADAGVGPQVFAPDEGALVQVLLYASEGHILAGAEPYAPESLVGLFDWMPLVYRLRWSVASDPLPTTDGANPLQVLLAASADGAPGPTLAGSQPLTPTDGLELETGVWDQWLLRRDTRPSTAFRHFHRWFDKLGLATAPDPAGENWILAAFECLRPYEPASECAKDLNHQRTPQVVLGALCLGWAGQHGAAVQRLAEFGQALSAGERFLTLAHLIEQAWMATWHRPGPVPMTEEGRQRVNARLEAISRNAPEHGHVLQSVWSLLTAARSVGFAAYQSVDLPQPDMRLTAVPWDGERRSLLWMNLLQLVNEAVATMARAGDAMLQKGDEYKEACMRLANHLATFSKYREHFAAPHQWVFAEMAGPDGTPARANMLLDALLRRFHFPPEEVQPIRDRLKRYCTLS